MVLNQWNENVGERSETVVGQLEVVECLHVGPVLWVFGVWCVLEANNDLVIAEGATGKSDRQAKQKANTKRRLWALWAGQQQIQTLKTNDSLRRKRTANQHQTTNTKPNSKTQNYACDS